MALTFIKLASAHCCHMTLALITRRRSNVALTSILITIPHNV